MTNPSQTVALHTWRHLAEQIRPVDTGRVTEAGHRIIRDPVNGECIEFPYNSGFLVGKLIYPTMLDNSGKELENSSCHHRHSPIDPAAHTLMPSSQMQSE